MLSFLISSIPPPSLFLLPFGFMEQACACHHHGCTPGLVRLVVGGGPVCLSLLLCAFLPGSPAPPPPPLPTCPAYFPTSPPPLFSSLTYLPVYHYPPLSLMHPLPFSLPPLPLPPPPGFCMCVSRLNSVLVQHTCTHLTFPSPFLYPEKSSPGLLECRYLQAHSCSSPPIPQAWHISSFICLLPPPHILIVNC